MYVKILIKVNQPFRTTKRL